MKSPMLQCLLALSTLCALKMTAQVVPFTNIQQQVVFGIVQGSTPNNPNFYQWHQLSTTLQGVSIALEPTEVNTLFLEENNCKLQFSNFQFMTLLEASFDNAAFTTLHQGQSRQHVGWIDPPSSFLTLGTHKLKIRFQPGSSSNLLNREYNIVVVPAPQTMFGDNTQANDQNGNQLTTGNILALYDNPNCSNAAPVILAEGYDASNTTFPDFYRFAGNDLIDRLFAQGYKVYILNFNLANQDLRNNAAVYNSAIRYISSINGNKDVTASGVSMGGVIARYALAKAEADGTPLPVTSFVSIDAPQQGAVVDLDFQNLVKDKVDPPPASLLTTASKQLLVAHAWDPSRSEHLGFFNELNALNGTGYPKKVPTIGVACSRNVPNPNAGQVWLELKAKSIGIPILERSFTVKDEWAVAGSLLPTASTNIEVSGGRPAWLGYLSLPLLVLAPIYTELNTNIIRSSHPTFIPFKSALDLDAQGVSKFTIPIQQEETGPSFHDRIPVSIGRQVVDVLGVDITTIAANETYNFTALKGRFIRKSIQVNGKMGINKNLASGSSLATTPEAKFNVPLQTLLTSPCSPVTINVESGGSIDMSDNAGNDAFNSNFTLKSDDIVRIKSGGTLKINKESALIIESGAKLIVDGGTINLIDNNSKIIIKQGGQLVINGNATINLVALTSQIVFQNGGELVINNSFTYAGTGYFSFEQGNKVTLNTDWTLIGTGRTSRLINVENNAEININNGRLWTIRDALVRKVGTSGGDVILLNNGATFAADNVIFDDQVPNGSVSFVAAYEAVDLDNNPDDMEYSFRNCAFANTQMAVAIGGGDLGNRFSFRNLNTEFINTTFTDCPTAYSAEHGWITTFENCTILRGGIDVQRMYWLQMRNTTMRGGPANSGYNATNTGIKLTFSIHNWITNNCLISDYGTGIDATEGINGNIRLAEGTTIQRCATAIKQNGGDDFGLLHMDCTRILENTSGIKGRDILLSAYGRNTTANVYTRTRQYSRFPIPFFENVYEIRQETDIWLHRSFWDTETPTTDPWNNFWRFGTLTNGVNGYWGGTVHINPVITNPNNVDVQSCGGVQTRDADSDSLARANAIVLVNGEYRNVRIQQDAALSQLRQNNLADAVNLFSPVAGIVNGVRDTANSVVRHFVDVARVMAQGQSSITTRSKSRGWLPETLVEIPKVINEFTLSPNPANDAVQLTIKSGNYHLRVSNAIGQTVFTQNTEGPLSVNVATWTNGIYLFELTDKATKKQQRSKIVVQH